MKNLCNCGKHPGFHDPDVHTEKIMTDNQKTIIDWALLYKQIENGWHMSYQDKQQLLQLNHVIMEIANKIHNDSMLDKNPKHLTCQDCGTTDKTVKKIVCGFDEEILNKKTLETVCADCEQEHLNDI